MILVRPAEPADADAAIDIVRASIQQLCVADHHDDAETLAAWLGNKTPLNLRSWLSNPENFCVVAESGDRLLGVGFLHRRGEILLLYLAPGAQRQGGGRMTHAALQERAVRWECASLYLDSTALARPFYESLGYRATGPALPRFGVLECFPYAKQLQSHTPLEPSPHAGSDRFRR